MEENQQNQDIEFIKEKVKERGKEEADAPELRRQEENRV